MQKIFKSINNATLMPLDGDLNRFTSGVFDADGVYIEGSMLGRNNCPAIFSKQSEKMNGIYAFGGYIFRHFGHYLIESLSRVYALQTLPQDIPILFMTKHESIPAKYANILRLLNVKNKIMLIKVPTKVDVLLYSEEGCSLYPLMATASQLKALGKFNSKPPDTIKFSWLSRSYLSLLGGVDNEIEVENLLQEVGFNIVHPERLSILEQLEIISKSKIVAGFSGSAFYSALLSKHIYGDFHIFARGEIIATAIPYFLEAKQIKVIKYHPKIQYSAGYGPRTRTILENPKEVVESLLKGMLS